MWTTYKVDRRYSGPLWYTQPLSLWPHQESVVLVSRFSAFSCVLEFYEMQKLETQFFFQVIMCLVFILGIRVYFYIDLPAFLTISAFSLKAANLHFGQKWLGCWGFDVLYVFWVFFGFPKPKIPKLHFLDALRCSLVPIRFRRVLSVGVSKVVQLFRRKNSRPIWKAPEIWVQDYPDEPLRYRDVLT